MGKTLVGLSILAVALMLPSTVLCLAQAGSDKAISHNSTTQVAGTWRGNSVCTVKDSPCHDEENIYRISEVAGKPGLFSVTGSKVVNGKEIVMGTGEWKYDAEKHTLEADLSGGSFQFTVDGNRMEGTLSLPDNTVYRRVHLIKDADRQPK